MAQKRFHNYQDAVESSRLGNKLAQMIPPGRYGGFNTFAPTAGTLNFGITHTTNPAHKTTINPGSPALSNNLGLLVTNQGTFIEEDNSIAGLSVGSNAANAFTRYDVLYVEHEYVNVVGGQAATYGVVQGTANLTVPALPNPLLQTAIGLIEIHQNETNLDNAFYHPYLIPTLGGEETLIWEDLTPLLDNGWTTPGTPGATPLITLDKDGWVHMRGVIDPSSATADRCFASVPQKYFPKVIEGLIVGVTNLTVGSGIYNQANETPASLKLIIYYPGAFVGVNTGNILVDSATSLSSVNLQISWWVGKDPSMTMV